MPMKIMQKYGCTCGCLFVFVVILVFVWMVYIAANTVMIRVNEKTVVGFPPTATDICTYYSFSGTCYEYSIEINDFFQIAHEEGWNVIPIPDEPIGYSKPGVEVTCFHYEKHREDDNITSDSFYSKIITRGYYSRRDRRLIVYDSDSKRLYYWSSRH